MGIWFAPIGLAAAVGLALYFLGAVVAHVRVKAPAKESAPAILLMLIAIATAVLEGLR